MAIGALDGSVSMNIFCCNIEADLSVNDGLMIGSLENNADISIKNSSVKFKGSGMILSCIGSVHGKKAEIKLAECGFSADIGGNNSTCLGSLYGSSDIRVDFLTLRITNSGQEALAFGGYDPDTVVALINTDTNSSVKTALGKDTFAPPENFRVVNGRQVFMVNDYEVPREVTVEYK